jgi:hypothetical protein
MSTKTKPTEADQSMSPGATSSPRPTNRYSPEEQDRLKVAGETAQWINKLPKQCCDGWLEVIGPAMVMVRDRIFEETGATSKRDQAYRDVVNAELKKYGLGEDVIPRDKRSCLLNIMEHLPDVKAWLASLTNADQLNDPKTIWKHFKRFLELNLKYEVEPIDDEDDEAWFGDDPDPQPVECALCKKMTIHFVPRAEGLYCLECHEANPEGMSKKDTGDGDGDGDKPIGDTWPKPTRKPKTKKRKARGDDADGDGDGDDTGDDADDDYYIDYAKELPAIRRLWEEWIDKITEDRWHEDDIAEEKKRMEFICGDNGYVHLMISLNVDLIDSTFDGDFTIKGITDFYHVTERIMRAALDDAREQFSKVIAQIELLLPATNHAPRTVPGDPTPELPSSGLGLRVDDEGVTHVPGKMYAQALKKHGHNPKKVTLADVGIKE